MLDYTLEENQKKLKDALKESKEGITISFTKVSGDKRVMLCSLNPDVIKELEAAKEDDTLSLAEKEWKVKRYKTASPNSLSVVDVNKKEWRSFRWDLITDVNI